MAGGGATGPLASTQSHTPLLCTELLCEKGETDVSVLARHQGDGNRFEKAVPNQVARRRDKEAVRRSGFL